MAARAALILLISLPSTACGIFSSPPAVPLAVPVKPGADLLKTCDDPMLPDPAKPIEANGEALQDLALKFRECKARQAKLVEWFGEQ